MHQASGIRPLSGLVICLRLNGVVLLAWKKHALDW